MCAVILCLLGGAAYAEKTVGVIMTGDIVYYQQIHEELERSLSGLGDVKLVVQRPTPEPMSWTNSARKLVTIGSKVIVAYGAPATLTAMKETSSIPIIFAGVYDPEAMRITGKNATGISSKVSISGALEALKAVSPMKSLGVIFNKAEKDTILQVREVKLLEKKMGFKTVLFDAKKKDFAGKVGGVDAILLTTSCAAQCSVVDIIGAAKKGKIPTASTIGGGEKLGIIFTYLANPAEQGKTAGGMVREVLGGKDPSGMALKKPGKVDFIVNIKEAGLLGIEVPGSIRAKATEIIE
jgi:putative ABC transport system substrate-binding protein